MSVPVTARCEASTPGWRGYHTKQCRNRAKIERDGKFYCGTHDPVAVKAKREKQAAVERLKWARIRAVQDETDRLNKERDRRAEAYPKIIRGLQQILARGFAAEADVRAIIRDLLKEIGEP
jgi:uncharacterized Zn finger protein (UPF0148 family)